MIADVKEHWETIYKTKQPNEVSWTQEVPAASLAFIHQFKIPKNAKIIDIGGGDSNLVDFLLAEGYTNLSVLDISEAAILRAQERLGMDAPKVTWIVCDILDFKPKVKYDGMVIIGTFSTDGPTKCSGLEIQQYDEDGMKAKFIQSDFKNLECKREDHVTPSGAVQNFVFCSFMKR